MIHAFSAYTTLNSEATKCYENHYTKYILYLKHGVIEALKEGFSGGSRRTALRRKLSSKFYYIYRCASAMFVSVDAHATLGFGWMLQPLNTVRCSTWLCDSP
jgi:hypothetical protein